MVQPETVLILSKSSRHSKGRSKESSGLLEQDDPCRWNHCGGKSRSQTSNIPGPGRILFSSVPGAQPDAWRENAERELSRL